MHHSQFHVPLESAREPARDAHAFRPDKGSSERTVRSELEVLDAEIGKALGVVDTLREVLGPILGPESPEVAGDPKEPHEPACDLAAVISHSVKKARTLRYCLQSMVHRTAL